MNKKREKKTKAKINQKNLQNNYTQDFHTINKDDYVVKNITADGNCFYRSLSFYYRQTEKDFDEFRKLIISYIENNLDNYISFVADEEINEPDFNNYSNDIKINKKREYLLDYTDKAKQDKVWAGYLEISTASILFNANLRLYTVNNNTYKLFNEFSQEYNENRIIDTINILFINHMRYLFI